LRQRKTRKIDIHARFARMNINFPTFLAHWCAARASKTVRAGDSWSLRMIDKKGKIN
jgi:hypothetical protein